MTGISTAVGAMPLVIATGPGAETRLTLGIVILFGVISATCAALVVIPAAYRLLARGTGSPGRVAAALAHLERKVLPLHSTAQEEDTRAQDSEPTREAR
jgi:multidrug efflux pump